MTYHLNCNNASHSCQSGCCSNYLIGCANIQSQCQWRYSDYFTNTNYSYMKYHSNCNSTADNCISGCCNINGTCALSNSECKYKYSDYNVNSNYYYPGPNPKYNLNCISTARDCISGCCTATGICATTQNECYYKYTDYQLPNAYYYYSYTYYGKANLSCTTTSLTCPSGCCRKSGYCAFIQADCYYPYSDYGSNANYYFQKFDNSTPYLFHHLNCNDNSHNCAYGCCDQKGQCVQDDYKCKYRYVNFFQSNNGYIPLKDGSPRYLKYVKGGMVGVWFLLALLIWLIACLLKYKKPMPIQSLLNTSIQSQNRQYNFIQNKQQRNLQFSYQSHYYNRN